MCQHRAILSACELESRVAERIRRGGKDQEPHSGKRDALTTKETRQGDLICDDCTRRSYRNALPRLEECVIYNGFVHLIFEGFKEAWPADGFESLWALQVGTLSALNTTLTCAPRRLHPRKRMLRTVHGAALPKNKTCSP